MAKRFVDTDLFKKRFIKGLPAAYKLLWVYILNECNHAGIYEVEIEIAIMRLDCEDISERGAITLFGDKIVLLDGGTKWFIPSFIEFQYGQLAENNRAHTGIISLLKKYSLIDSNLKIKPLTSPLQGDKDMDKEEEMDMETVKEKGRNEETEEVFEALKVHFDINELNHFNLIRELDSFCMVLQSKKQIPYFIQQFKAYQDYKTKAQEKVHNFKGFIGTVEKGYEDGGWCADNWVHKLNNYKDNGKQTTDYGQLKADSAERMATIIREKHGSGNQQPDEGNSGA